MEQQIPLPASQYVAVTGPVGSGKTTLTNRLAQEMRWTALLESPDKNPFLASYYADPPRFAFLAQAWFQIETLSHEHTIATVRGHYVLERTLLERHEVFIESLALGGALSPPEKDALDLILQEETHVAPPPPALILALQGPPRFFLERVRRRGHDYEMGLNEDWFRAHVQRYEMFWRQTTIPVLALDTTAFEFNDPSTLAEIALKVYQRIGSAV